MSITALPISSSTKGSSRLGPQERILRDHVDDLTGQGIGLPSLLVSAWACRPAPIRGQYRKDNSAVERQRLYHLFDDPVAFRTYLLISGILDRVRHKDPRRCWQTQRFRLRLGRIDEDICRDDDRWLTICFEPHRIVQTARYTASSIGESFDDEVTFLHHLAPHPFGPGPRRTWPAILLHLDIG